MGVSGCHWHQGGMRCVNWVKKSEGWRDDQGGRERRSSRIKRREAEPGCEPGWRGCSAGT